MLFFSNIFTVFPQFSFDFPCKHRNACRRFLRSRRFYHIPSVCFVKAYGLPPPGPQLPPPEEVEGEVLVPPDTVPPVP